MSRKMRSRWWVRLMEFLTIMVVGPVLLLLLCASQNYDVRTYWLVEGTYCLAVLLLLALDIILPSRDITED